MRRIHREWIEIGHGIRFGIGATVVTLSHREPRVTYVGTEVGYIYRSLDGGVTWDETRLLPDDVPLLNVPLMNLNSLPFPNDGLRDSFRAPLDPWMFDTLFGSHSRTYARPETYGMTGYETGTTRYTFPSVLAHSSTYAGGGGGARVETEDPGNLMALYFSGIAAQAGRVNWLEICATDPSVAFAATNFGAFRTRDMGITWDRVFIGSSTEENSVRSVHCHPENANNVYLATAQGMRISRDGGDQWERPTGNLGAWGTNFITTHPLDRQKLLVGTDIGSYATISGAEEETLYFADQPAPEVRSVTVVRGTSDPNTMYVGTRDGAAYTHNGGETWTRMGEFLLGHYPIYALEVDPRDPQHLYVQTPYHLFESYDGGASLEEILTGYTDLRFSLLDPLDPDVLWVVGYSQVWRYQRPEPTPSGPPSEAARRAREALSVDPGLDETMERALARAHLDQRHVQEHRQNIRRSSLVPTADLAGWIGFNFGRMSSTTTNINLSHYSYFFDLGCNMYEMATAYCGYRGGSFAINPQDSFDLNYFGVFLVLAWPLGRAVLDERATGRMWLDILRMRDRVMYMVYDYWSDRHRMLNYLARGGNDLLAEQAYVMRLEEMSAVLDGMTDGFLGGPFGESRRR
jgi:photosystem II stability/assembly factor-like uncharacterized protein